MAQQLARRQVGRRLKTEREKRRIRLEDIPADIMSRWTLWRIEKGERAIKNGELWELLDFYGSDPDTVRELTEMAGETRANDSRADDGVSDVWVSTYLDLERVFSRMSYWHSWLVHALLQTDGYARAVVASDNVTDEEVINARLKRRAARQQHAMSRPDRELDLVLAEAVFTQMDLGEEVLRDQHRHLVACDRLTGIDIRVLPAKTGIHPGIRGPFTIMDFTEEADPSIVYLENLTGSRYLDQDRHVSPYRAAFTQLKELSVSIEEYQLP